jgi:glycosyltransferase involved in cell wall biosynthesis
MDAAVGVSQRSLVEMIQHYSFKKPSLCIPRAVDIDFFANYIPEAYARKEVGIPENAFVLLFLGNFTNQKRPDRFIDIINLVKASIPYVHGLMVGDGPLRSAINEQISSLSLEKNITCVGYKQDVRPWIAMSDVLLLTSDTEGMPGVVLEAAAMRKSTISNNIGGIMEIISDQENGFIVRNGDVGEFISKIIDLNLSAELRFKHRNAIFESIHLRNSFDIIFKKYKLFFSKTICDL